MAALNNVTLLQPEDALPGRDDPMAVVNQHAVTGKKVLPPHPEGTEWFALGMGCFWGAERRFWQQPGVYTTAVGYTAGYTPNPTYEEVCSGLTGHNEVVLVIYDPTVVSFVTLLALFWESHNPTQGARQGNDQGTQYRSGLYCSTDAQKLQALTSLIVYQKALSSKGLGTVTTEVLNATEFYYAENYHQQYLAKNPNGYCGLEGTGVTL